VQPFSTVSGLAIKQLVRFIIIPSCYDLGSNGTLLDTPVKHLSQIYKHVNLRDESWPLDGMPMYGGSEWKRARMYQLLGYDGYNSNNVHEPTVRALHENVSPNCYSSPYSLRGEVPNLILEVPNLILESSDDEDETTLVPEQTTKYWFPNN
jgi:hypothetical protein